jgi:hypothetical protein
MYLIKKVMAIVEIKIPAAGPTEDTMIKFWNYIHIAVIDSQKYCSNKTCYDHS